MAQHPGDAAVPMPYISKLNQHLNPGQTLIIHGSIDEGAQRFEVNLLQGSANIETCRKVVLHISVRFDEKKIVFNTYEGGAWGKEERVSNPFQKKDKFDLRIRAHEDKFEVMADQKEIHEFKLRSLLADVEFFVIKGDVTLSGVHWGGRYYELPSETQFPGGHLASGKRIYIYGTPKGERFNIDFLGRNGDILFHYNPRFKEKHVVRNAQINGAWGQEEREGVFPFKKEVGFDLVLFNEPYSIQVFCDGDRIGTFAHRTGNPGMDYHGLRVAGEVELTSIEYSSDHHEHY